MEDRLVYVRAQLLTTELIFGAGVVLLWKYIELSFSGNAIAVYLVVELGTQESMYSIIILCHSVSCGMLTDPTTN